MRISIFINGLIYLGCITVVHELVFWSPLPNTGYLAKLDSGGGAWFCLNLVSQNLVTPKGGLFPLRRVLEWDGRSVEAGEWEGAKPGVGM